MSNDKEMKPCVLLVEDDAISRQFMAAALESLPAQVDAMASMAAALSLPTAHDLWLLDANLPDGSGIELLGQLRERFPATPALAHTADDSGALRAQLLAAGFSDVLVKPLGAAQLRQTVNAALPGRYASRFRVNENPLAQVLPLWDGSAALAALNGNHEHVGTLRQMFLAELPTQCEAIAKALTANDHATARHLLHQLKASSGFAGAMRLHAAAVRLDKSPADPALLNAFKNTVDETLASAT